MSSSSTIPTSTAVIESAVIRAPLSHVWHHIKLQDFSNFWSALQTSEFVKGVSNEADVVKWTFKDGTIVEVKQEEHSVGYVPPTKIRIHRPRLSSGLGSPSFPAGPPLANEI